MGKLRASAAEDASIVPEQIAPKPSRLTSADILGLNRQRAAGKQRIMSVEMELDKYLSDSNSGTGILEYWQVNLIILTPSNLNFFTNMLYNFQEHQHSFPRIFHLAMDIIPIQASSVPCERVFSSGKQTMVPRRSRISAQLMECLQILKFSIRKGNALKFTEGMSWKDELREFEHMALTVPLGDPEAYGRSLEDPDEDSDALEDVLDEMRKDLELEALEEELMNELASADDDDDDGKDDEDDEDDEDDIYV